jgi:putative phosphonate transport system ATP-binding protein
MNKILEARDLSKLYGPGCPQCLELTGPQADTNLCPRCGTVVAMHGVSFDLHEGEILGVMGESGSGKSTVVKSLCFDLQPSAGKATYWDDGAPQDLFALNAARQRWIRNHRFGIVYQDPRQGLNFNITAGGNIAERLLMSDLADYGAIRSRAKELLARMEVLLSRVDDLPRNFSGGMRQRVQIAKALATRPPLLFLDEVTSGLDLSVQARILDLILEIQQELKTAMVVVTHDLGVIRLLTDRAIVMKYGRIIESGLTDQILEDPQHAFTQRLVASAL